MKLSSALRAPSWTSKGFCLLLLTALHALAADTSSIVKIPSRAEIFSSLRKGHPRLLLSADEFNQLKAQIAASTNLQSRIASIRDEGKKLLDAPPSKYEIPDGLRLLDTSRRVVHRIYVLGLLYRLEGDRAFADRAWKELEAAAAFPDWNPRHFLDTAEMTHAFAIGYDLLYDAWTDEQRKTLQTAMVDKGFKPALKVYRGNEWWVKARHNWNQVCNGGIGVGALALAEVEPELCSELLQSAVKSIPLAMAEFAPDGAWAEGPGYWNYATSYNVTFLAALESALGTDFGLSNIPGFDKTGLFPLHLTGPLGRTFNYADGGDGAIRAPQLLWFSKRFKQPVFAWYELQHGGNSVMDLCWNDAPALDPEAAGVPRDTYFRGAEVATFRSSWIGSKSIFAAFKAGDNKANHSHLDLGSFVLDALGARWAVDLGADNYNLPGYFGEKRWNYYRLRAEGQNTLVVNPGVGPDQDPSAASRIVRFETSDERSFAIADLTPAYKKHARQVWRGCALLKRQRLLVQDEVITGAPADVWWFMHTPAAAVISDEGRTATLEQVGAKLKAEIISPPGARLLLMDAQPLPNSPHPDGQAKNEKIRKLAIHLEAVKETRIAVLLTPIPTDTPAPIDLPRIIPLSEWKNP